MPLLEVCSDRDDASLVSKICRANCEVCGNDVSTPGQTVYRNIRHPVGSFGCDS